MASKAAKQEMRQTLEAINQWLSSPRKIADPRAFAGNPIGYAEQVLGIRTLTPPQKQILRLLHEPPGRVLVPAGHDVGKTFVAAVAVNYWYDSFDPGVVLTSAPTQRDVVDLLWTEVRLQRQRAGLASHFVGPRAPEMRTSDDHYAKGYTAVKGESFQGRHRDRMLFVFDEATGISPIYWTTVQTMFDLDRGHAQLSIFNPTDTTSEAYRQDMSCDAEDGRPRWHRVRLSALDHPNIAGEANGSPVAVRGAVTVAMISDWVRDWCEPVAAHDVRFGDVQWPLGSGQYHRPGPVFQSRAQGVWPDTGDGVWSPSLIEMITSPQEPSIVIFPEHEAPTVGCDCAQGKGEDYHAIHGRWGDYSIHHETANNMDAVKIKCRIAEVCRLLAERANAALSPGRKRLAPEDISIAIDDDGTGNAVAAMLKREGFRVVLVSAAMASTKADRYPRRRDELWFAAKDRAALGKLHLGLLPKDARARLRQQLLAPSWDLDAAGRRQVEPKDETKKKIGRSPDDADAMNLAYLDFPSSIMPGDPLQAMPKRQWQDGGRRGPDDD